MGHKVGRSMILHRLPAEKFSLQGNSKTEEGGEHEDRLPDELKVEPPRGTMGPNARPTT